MVDLSPGTINVLAPKTFNKELIGVLQTLSGVLPSLMLVFFIFLPSPLIIALSFSIPPSPSLMVLNLFVLKLCGLKIPLVLIQSLQLGRSLAEVPPTTKFTQRSKMIYFLL
ncbi:PREDICTED: uncharacterized protein LOC105965555 [Erythranthe guttata]|uniref:uncharacterized protein LOC105965555 n=1 Tax=Erythranthe guttata TaxID=4155 RepID=UPI00064D9948|nr:PREDICTED: uncharacterized protein LOC105965555 [Erythranthe guttata]|eukprot:XP_012845572.1 PREDICTED: uncharacterized protein LOC105965555 [Erythranthe guttata]